MSYKKIRIALESRLNSLTLPVPIAWENVQFDPDTSDGFIRPSLAPVARLPQTVGLSPQQRISGLFDMTVIMPEGRGPQEALDIAETLITAFDASTYIEEDGLHLTIQEAGIREGFVSSPWYILPVIVNWSTYI